MLRLDNDSICQHVKHYNSTSMDFHSQREIPPTDVSTSNSITMNAPPTPHSRNASLTDTIPQPTDASSLSALKMNPHRTMMSIDALITPPNSGECKRLSTFDQVDTVQGAVEQDVLFPSLSNQNSKLQLFNQVSRQSVSPKYTPLRLSSTQVLSIDQEQAVEEWHQRDGPHWEKLKTAGMKRPRGVNTWKDYIKYEGMVGNHIARPTHEEYILVVQALNKMKGDTMDWTKPQHITTPTQKKSKVLQDISSKRRGLVDIAPSSRKRSSTPSVMGELSNQPSIHRRRASRNNPKTTGPETKSARAPSSKPPKDPDWWNYQDYAPDFEQHAPANAMTCANSAHKFDNKDNKKGPRDLSADPERNNLHEAELIVASWLHLDCHRYLTSKRQIFQGYIEHLRRKHVANKRIKEGLEEPGQTKLTNWNKTEAQKLLGIDVSKGSYIWSFYKDLGWFEDSALHLYEHHLQE